MFCSTETAAQTIGICGGIQDILAAMRAYPSNVELIAACCSALWSLTVNGKCGISPRVPNLYPLAVRARIYSDRGMS